MLNRTQMVLVQHRALEADPAGLAIWHQELLHVLVQIWILVGRLRLPVIELAQRTEVGPWCQIVGGLFKLPLRLALGHPHPGQDGLLFQRDSPHGLRVPTAEQVVVVLAEGEALGAAMDTLQLYVLLFRALGIGCLVFLVRCLFGFLFGALLLLAIVFLSFWSVLFFVVLGGLLFIFSYFFIPILFLFFLLLIIVLLIAIFFWAGLVLLECGSSDGSAIEIYTLIRSCSVKERQVLDF